MIQAGKNITQINDPLQKIKPEQLYHSIRNPKPEIAAQIRQLRMVNHLDAKRYSELKRKLPYVVCGIFSPEIRRTEHFAWINHFILDFDHLSNKEINPDILRGKLASDPEVLMIFTSPGGDGLKVMFGLHEKCFDAAQYKLFYKIFAQAFARKFQLNQVVDSQTCDVTRACFISHDPTAWYNPEALPVKMSAWVNYENPLQVRDLTAMIKEEEARLNEISPQPAPQPKITIDDESLIKIKQTLNPNYKAKLPKEYIRSEAVEQLIDEIIARMTIHGIETSEILGIDWGKKFRFKLGLKEAEINLFHGKKGYSVVISPRTGTDNDFNQIVAQIITELIRES